eukprot:3519346-Prymnesium_polylepis.1
MPLTATAPNRPKASPSGVDLASHSAACPIISAITSAITKPARRLTATIQNTSGDDSPTSFSLAAHLAVEERRRALCNTFCRYERATESCSASSAAAAPSGIGSGCSATQAGAAERASIGFGTVSCTSGTYVARGQKSRRNAIFRS